MAPSDQKLYKLKSDLLKLIQSGQFKKAEKLYPRIKGHEIKDAELWRLFAGVHSQRGNFSEIVHCCSNILKINPDDFQITYNLAAALQNLNRTDEAIAYYEECIAIKPDYINAYANCALLYYLTGDIEKSVMYYRRVLENIDTPELRIQYSQSLMASTDHKNAILQLKYILSNNPNNKKALFYIAQCFYETQNYADSEKYYQQLLTLDENDIKVINNLGRLYDETGKAELAVEKYRQAIKIDNSIATIHLNLGKALVKIENLVEAEKAFIRCIELAPEHPEGYFTLGKLYNEKDQTETAKEYFIKALATDVPRYMEKPDEFILAVKYFISNLDNPELFNEDKKAFVADLFDGYADKFDKHLVEGLQYKTPEIINDLIATHVTKTDNNTLDLGCGTGLCCQYLKPCSRNIIGVDLSSKMVDKARDLDCYDSLIVGEITEVVNNLDQELDLVIAADVFVYIGSLDDIFHACSKKMSDNSYFIFSTELLAEDIENNFRLYDSGRYKHSTKYINQLISKYNFKRIEQHFCVLRKENGKDVNGCITILKKV